VFHTLAPQGSAVPYAIMQPQQPGVDAYTFGAGREISADWVVKVISDRQWPGQAINLFSYVDGLMQDAALSVTGWRVLRCRRVSAIQYQDPDRFWHVGGVYRVDLSKG
jgi:hypothetical protein